MGLVQQVIDRAPRWLVRRLTSTYLTLGLADITREVGMESEDDVRELIVDMVSPELLDFVCIFFTHGWVGRLRTTRSTRASRSTER